MDFKDGTNTGDDYAYDANGNLTKDLNKNIANIEYNVLNLPSKVTFGDGNSVSYMYAADGRKLQTVHIINGTTTTADYVGNMIYENGTLKRTLVDGGYIETDEKKSISPATVLEHEMDHLYKEVMTLDKDFGEYRVTTNKGTDAQYETKEERRVITGSEVKTARANNEYSRNYMRRNHGGSLIMTQGPISNKKVKYARFK